MGSSNRRWWIAAVLVGIALSLWPSNGQTAQQIDDPATYILENSRYGWKAVCVSRIETASWTAFWNPTPWGRYHEHAQGYFGWLLSTFYGIAEWGSPMDIDAEIEAFDRMLDARRGGEFYGLGGYSGRDGTGPCYR